MIRESILAFFFVILCAGFTNAQWYQTTESVTSRTRTPTASWYKRHTTIYHPWWLTTTEKPGEPNEIETFFFFYDSETRKLLLSNNKECYIYQMSEAEIDLIHTNTGMRSAELKVMGLMSTGTGLDKMRREHLHPSVVRHCGPFVTEYYQFLRVKKK